MVLILKVNTNVLLSSSVSQPISLHNVFKLIERVTPETILFHIVYNYPTQQMRSQVLALGMIYTCGSLFCDKLNI